MTRAIAFLAFLYFFTFIPQINYAQGDSINIYEFSIEELMTLEVDVASLVVKDLKKQPVSLISISGNQLEMSGARTLADALSMFVPGLFLVEDQDDVIMGFRGLAPDNNSKVMLLIDGQNLNIEWFWGPPPAILNSTHFDFIERVEVIRGPGSVTLGQGALLGVINIVTRHAKNQKNIKEHVSGSAKALYGMNEFWGIQAEANYFKGETSSFIYLGSNKYNGQELRNQGWANDKVNEGYRGGSVKDIGTRLKRSSNNSLIGNFRYKGFTFNTLIIDHQQDLYNFYRDRNRFGETLLSIAPSYNFEINPNISLKTIADAVIDNFSLHSVDGYIMGGTRENRYGVKVICNINEIVKGNRLALGSEYRRYEFGRSNFSGNNFINNLVTNELIDDQNNFNENANIYKVWGYKANINVISLFAEDYQSFGDFLDVFAGFRFDKHPFWGANFTPRFGAILSPLSNVRVRLSYQTGFRGAVGLHYGGGYRQDGLLSEENFSNIQASNIPIFDEANQWIGVEENLPITKPESMQGFELSVDWDISKQFNIYGIGFYNIISNVIDVGVIWRDPNQFSMVGIGSDIPGDWNGYWFFKNTEGNIVQGGFESAITYKYQNITASVNHSFVRLIHSSSQQRGSMYITELNNFKAYPENVTRFNFLGSITNDLSFGCSYLYYFYWYSPNDQKVSANHLLNLSVNYRLFDKINCSVQCTNVLNQSGLYPMNSNVGDAELSDGTPAIEKTSIWLGVKYNF